MDGRRKSIQSIQAMASRLPDGKGRSWNGWHHHAIVVTAAHAFLTEQRLSPKTDTPGSPFTRSSTPSRTR
jgi:SRSO17 transposase